MPRVITMPGGNLGVRSVDTAARERLHARGRRDRQRRRGGDREHTTRRVPARCAMRLRCRFVDQQVS